MLIEFDDMIAEIEINEKLTPIVIENLTFCLFLSHSYFKVPKTITLNATHFIMKIPNKIEILQIVSNP